MVLIAREAFSRLLGCLWRGLYGRLFGGVGFVSRFELITLRCCTTTIAQFLPRHTLAFVALTVTAATAAATTASATKPTTTSTAETTATWWAFYALIRAVASLSRKRTESIL